MARLGGVAVGRLTYGSIRRGGCWNDDLLLDWAGLRLEWSLMARLGGVAVGRVMYGWGGQGGC